MSKLWLLTIPVLVGAIGFGCFAEGAIHAYDKAEPSITLVPIRHTVIKEVPVEVKKPYYVTVTKEKPVEVIVYRNIFPRSWGSVAEFEKWYKEQDFKVIWNKDPDKADCDDYARHLQIEALKQGYPVSEALAFSGKYYGKKVTDHTRGHAGNMVLINNTYYWVEPYPEEFEVIRVASRD